MSDEWLLMKRGLYYRQNDCGYTGIRDHAGRYSAEEARSRLSPGIAMVRLDSAPEFTDACFDDLARQHLSKQRDEARAEIARLRVENDIMRSLIIDAPTKEERDALFERRFAGEQSGDAK